MTPELKQKLEAQIADPRHCYLLLDGRLFKHGKPQLPDDPLAHLAGLPVRFTRMAAEGMIEWASRHGAKAEIVEEGFDLAVTATARDFATRCPNAPRYVVGK